MASSRFVLLFVFCLWCIADSFQDDFANQVLKAHNNFRKIHGVPALALDDKLSKEATALANKFKEKGRLKLDKGDINGTGLNRAYLPKTEDTGYKVVVGWYEQICKNDNWKGLDNFTMGYTLDFTQVVWKGSKRIGVGMAISKSKEHDILYVAVLYDPRGNEVQKEKENVLRGKFQKSMCEDLLKIAKEN